MKKSLLHSASIVMRTILQLILLVMLITCYESFGWRSVKYFIFALKREAVSFWFPYTYLNVMTSGCSSICNATMIHQTCPVIYMQRFVIARRNQPHAPAIQPARVWDIVHKIYSWLVHLPAIFNVPCIHSTIKSTKVTFTIVYIANM